MNQTHWLQNFPLSSRQITSFDGTKLTYFVGGHGPRTLLLVPALSVPPSIYRSIIAYFTPKMKVVTWCARGSKESPVIPGPLSETSLSVEAHLQDIQTITQAENLDSFFLGGWYIAAQIALHYAALRPECCQALLLLNGGSSAPFSETDRSFKLAKGVLQGVQTFDQFAETALRQVVRAPRLMHWGLRRLGWTKSSIQDFVAIAQGCAEQPLSPLAKGLLALQATPAPLANIQQPALITAGTWDWTFSPKAAKALALVLPRATLEVFEKGTHYTLLEQPKAINRAILQFMEGLESGDW